MAELRSWKLKCPKGDLDLVFPNSCGKLESAQNLIQRGFYPALRRAKLRKIRSHDLRHTYASLLLHNREPITRVQAALGHASPAITLSVYAHLMPLDNQGVSIRLDELIGFRGAGSKTVAPRGVTVGRVPQLIEKMVAGTELNRRHKDFQCAARKIRDLLGSLRKFYVQ
jgi:hypothetical protein